MGKKFNLETIYSLYVQDVYRYIFSLCKNEALAQDIVQETFTRAFLYLESYKDEKIKPWLFKVAYHTFIDYIRKEKRTTYLEDVTTMPTKTVEAAEETFIHQQQINEWLVILDSLPVHKKNIVILRDYYHFSYQEIADMLGLSLPKVKVTLFRTRKEIQEKMKGSGMDEV